MLSMDRKNYMIRHLRTPWFFNASKSCAFGETLKMYLINSTPWVGLNWVRSRTGVTWVTRSDKCSPGTGKAVRGIDKSDGFKVRAFLRVKCMCQLIVKLKAIECYRELLCYLSSYINLLIIRLFARVSKPCVSATNNVIMPRFVQIVLLTMLLWLLTFE